MIAYYAINGSENNGNEYSNPTAFVQLKRS